MQPDIKQIDSFATPTFGEAYTKSFSKYKKDLNQVTTLMTGCRLGEGQQRHLGEGRNDGQDRDQDHDEQQAS